MKGLNINISSSCTSLDSTAILSSPNMDLPPSSSSPSSFSSSSSFSTYTGSGRAIDRHNPIITDEKRSGITSSSCTNTPLRTPCTNNVLQQKPTTPISVTTTPKNNNVQKSSPRQKGNKLSNKLTKKKTTTTKTSSSNKSSPVIDARSNNVMIHEGEYGRRSSFSRRSEMIMKASSACSNTRAGVDYISPPESSRYLLDDTSFLEVLNDFDPVLKLGNYDSKKCEKNNSEVVGSNNKVEEGLNSSLSKPSSCSASPEDQVVVLRVSLHCRGCERKMKKHLSRMAGVTSFNIDFAAKKVTVVGDVTPLGVLASISKVKTAKLWTPPTVMPSSSSLSSQLNSRNTNNMLPNNNNNQIDVKVA